MANMCANVLEINMKNLNVQQLEMKKKSYIQHIHYHSRKQLHAIKSCFIPNVSALK